MNDHIPGLQLSEDFFRQAVKPIVDREFPHLRYAAALIGSGSEVLGFDTAMSADHHWGSRAILFLSPDNHARYADAIRDVLANQLPTTFAGYSTHFSSPNQADHGTQLLVLVEHGPVNHRVDCYRLESFASGYLGIDLDAILEDRLSPVDWLTMTAQKLRTAVGGAVFQDDTGELTRLRAVLNYYPHDVWLYLLAAGWTRIGQEEHFMGRTGYVGDEIGSRLIAARLIHDLMNLCFLMERQYAPYSKWFGTAFARLKCAPQLLPLFDAVLNAAHWQEREVPLCQAYEIIAEMHNALGITEPMSEKVTPFFDRPFQIIGGERFANAIIAHISDPEVKRIAEETKIGSLEQFSDNTDFLSDSRMTQRARALYDR